MAPDHGLAAAPAGGQAPADAAVEGQHPGLIADLVGHQHDGHGGVEGGVEPGESDGSRARCGADRGGHQPAGVDAADDGAVLLDPVLVAHRAAGAGGGPPVDLADVVVGHVVPDRLEVGPEPERAPGEDAGVPEPAVTHGHHQPVGGRHVRVDEDLALLAGPVVDPAEPEPAFDPHRRGREGMAASTPGDQRGGERPVRLPGFEVEVGRDGLTDPARRPAGVDVDDEFGRHAPGQDPRHRPLQRGGPPHGGGVAGRPGHESQDDQRRQRRREEEEAQRGAGEQGGQPGGRAHRRSGDGRRGHRGTGTEARAAATASSGR